MLQNLRLALFDYDGTIVDSAIMIVEGAIAAFRICGLPDPDPKKVRENIGKPLAIALDEYMPPGFNITPNEISEAYRSWYAEQGRLGLQNEPLYPGVVELLKELKTNDWLIGIATNKSRIGLTNGLAKHSLSDMFDITLSTDENIPKPNPAMAIKAMNDLGVDKENCVMIGDTINDIGLGVNAGITSIGVTWGYNDKNLLLSAGANYLVDDANQLNTLMKEIFN
ncbi:HAD-IA family hydrolase [Alphaproteobacteria bacterium]|nr:HAD-IA family hydrolase [Alphaproteobacteria bacterium]MDC1086708.1 HAD-IA family hydrolase [Alphaproteobacteria bacterium]